MREFMRKAIKKSQRMNEVQLKNFVKLITDEYSILDAVMDSLSDGVIAVNAENKIVKYNRAAERILESNLCDSQEENIWEYINEKKIADFISSVIQNERGETTAEFNLLNEDKSKFIDVSVLPLVKEKKINGTIILVADVTEKRNEEIKTHRLESLARLTNVAATVAHEIKNPLAAISIHLQLLKKNFTACNLAINQKAQKHISIIEEEIERLNKIIVDFLFAVRPLKFEFALVDINALLNNLHETFLCEFNNYGISLSLDLQKDLPLIRGDERFLRQAFMNVITNARAAMPNGGFLDITTRLNQDMVSASISDSGQGISTENLNKIFEPYFTTKNDGTGLGLTMTYKVIKEHGGDIHVYSDYGMGTTFKFLLPIARYGSMLMLQDKNNTEKK